MSFRVLVIPEDATKDHYVLKPVMRSLLSEAGKPRAVVQVLTDPAVQGVDQALDDAFLAEVVGRYPMVDLFVLCVDRDGRPGRDVSTADRKAAVAAHLQEGSNFLATAAHQELEVWCLAGMKDLPREWRWREVRADPSAKENYFDPYVAFRGLESSPGEGREILGREAATRFKSVRDRCDEVSQLLAEVQSL